MLKFLLFFSLAFAVVASQNPSYTCTGTVAKHVVNYVTFYTKIYFKCGWLGMALCQKIQSYPGSYGTYITQIDCCLGYGGPNCTAICDRPECNDNEECIGPNTCGCLEGWTGYRCLTDIDECSLLTDECELRSSCNNTDGGYLCSCEYPDVLASDDRRCLSPVSNLVVAPFRRNISLTWSPPANYTSDGEIDQYRVYCNITGNSGPLQVLRGDGLYTKNLSAVLSPLSPFTDYICCVEAMWANGDISNGNCSEVQTLEDTPEDIPRNFSVQSVDSMNLLIEWKPPLIPNGLISSYTLRIDYTNHSKIYSASVGSDIDFFLLGFLYPHQLVGVSVSASTGGGQGPFTDFEFNRTRQSPPGSVHNLNVAVLSLDRVNITWHPPQRLNGIIITYYISLFSTTEQLNDWSINAEDDLQTIVNGLEPYIPYRVEVKAATVAGRGVSAPFTFFTKQKVPDVSPTIILATRQAATSIAYAWRGLREDELGGFLQFYTVSYARSCNTSEEVIVNTTDTKLSLQSLDPLEMYCFQVSASTIMGSGPFSESYSVQTFPSSDFYFHIMGLYDCSRWTQSSSISESIETIKERLTVVVNGDCDCGIQPSYFKFNFTCDPVHRNRVTVQGRLVGTVTHSSDEVVTYIDNWTNFSSIIVLDGVQFSLLNCDSNPEACQAPTIGATETPSAPSTALSISLGVLISAFVTITLFSIVAGVVIYILKKRAGRRARPITGTSGPPSPNIHSITNPLAIEEVDDDFDEAVKFCETSEDEGNYSE